MVYKVIGLMSGSSLDGLDIAYVHLQENRGRWEFDLVHTACHPYPEQWRLRLMEAPALPALDYLLLHTDYGHYLGGQVNQFIREHDLSYKVQLIASHGHTSFHVPGQQMTAQLGDGAALAAETMINVVSDLRAMDLALGGQGAPIVPIGEKLLFPGYGFFLNLGGIANISGSPFAAFDVCPANRVLNSLAGLVGKSYDEGGTLAASGAIDQELLRQLNALPYYDQPYPKSLANDFGTDTVYPMITSAGLSVEDALRTCTEHIAMQISRAIGQLLGAGAGGAGIQMIPANDRHRLLITGGGAHNTFLTGRLQALVEPLGMTVEVPDKQLVDYKEALIMALIGVLRWREENNVLASVTGASRDSIGGAVWIGQEA